ncbi:MAG: biotin transporter BioY [Candidatus Omnitrophica bacterium]|nr:biotin transporter BioY [Candidatus Omnitrophota bacterium]MCM8799812.1 biotin transporter BioY [Candidatus Omnitrophota bacterium]
MRESILAREIITSKVISRIILVCFSVISISLSSYVRIPLPFSPVPITLQTLFVLLTAALLREKLATLTIFIYLMLGIAGFPVFTFNSSIFYLFGPTAGYLIGFLLSSFLVGRVLSYFKKIDFFSAFFSLFLGEIIILSLGTIWLKVSLALDFKKALILGAIPFIPLDLFKLWIAVKLFLKLNPRIRKII